MDMLQYFSMTLFVTAVVTYFVLKSFESSPFPPDGDDDAGGGMGNPDLPLIDIPPGSSLSFLQVDRLTLPKGKPVTG
jgi:hypothetical protein